MSVLQGSYVLNLPALIVTCVLSGPLDLEEHIVENEHEVDVGNSTICSYTPTDIVVRSENRITALHKCTIIFLLICFYYHWVDTSTGGVLVSEDVNSDTDMVFRSIYY